MNWIAFAAIWVGLVVAEFVLAAILLAAQYRALAGAPSTRTIELEISILLGCANILLAGILAALLAVHL